MKAAGTDAALAHTMPPSLPSRNRTRGGGTALAGGGLAARGLHRSRQLGSLRRRPATADCAASPPLRCVVPCKPHEARTRRTRTEVTTSSRMLFLLR